MKPKQKSVEPKLNCEENFLLKYYRKNKFPIIQLSKNDYIRITHNKNLPFWELESISSRYLMNSARTRVTKLRLKLPLQ